ncbi:unnamed protein product [Meloidogyne enterolobii]|uniref:Uncharacterized protein n=1 Tax=Meloidogyne enterolobii TaxID=390850 RepID=A0ACB0ZAD5_MELEN
MSPSSFTLTVVVLEAIVFLYNRQVATMLSMHPSCSGRSSTIENKLKMSGGGKGTKHLMPGNVSFPVACHNHRKNLKAVNGTSNKISEALNINPEKLINGKENDLIHKMNKAKKGNGAAVEHYIHSVPYNTEKNDESGKDSGNGKAFKTMEALQEYPKQNKNDKENYQKREELEHYLNSIPYDKKAGKNEKSKKVTKAGIIEKETDPMFHSKAGNLAKKIKEYIKNTDEFKIQAGLLNRNDIFNAPKDDTKNLIDISYLLMSFNEDERGSVENLKSAAELFVALHEGYQIYSVTPLIFEVEMVLKKLEEEGNKDDPIKLLEYFSEKNIKYPLWDLLKIKEDSKVSSDEAIEKFSKIIHKADNFLAKNTHLFFENGNELILNRIDSRIETSDLVLASIKKILKIFNNFKDNFSENYSQLKRLKPIEMHDLFENSELLQKLYEAILPGDEMMKFK